MASCHSVAQRIKVDPHKRQPKFHAVGSVCYKLVVSTIWLRNARLMIDFNSFYIVYNISRDLQVKKGGIEVEINIYIQL